MFLSCFIIHAQGILIMDDLGSECSRTKLKDLILLNRYELDKSNYFEVYSENLSLIEENYSEFLDYTTKEGFDTLTYHTDVPNNDYGSYYFIKYKYKKTGSDSLIFEKILKVEISADAPYKFASIEYVKVDELSLYIDVLKDRIITDFNPLIPPPPPLWITSFQMNLNSSTCYNYPVLFGLLEIDFTDRRNDKIRSYYTRTNEINDETKKEWIKIHNTLNLPVITNVVDSLTEKSSILSLINTLKVNYLLKDTLNYFDPGFYELDNLCKLNLIYYRDQMEIDIPVSLSKLSNLRELRIIFSQGKRKLSLPNEVILMPTLNEIRIDRPVELSRDLWNTVVEHYSVDIINNNRHDYGEFIFLRK